MQNLKYDTNEFIHETETDSQMENRLVVAGGTGAGEDWIGSLGLADADYAILYLNKVLFYSTGNCIQHPVINHNGKNMRKNLYIYVMYSRSAVSDSLPSHGLEMKSMGILQARILEWVAMPSSREFSQPRDQTQVSHIAGRFYTI